MPHLLAAYLTTTFQISFQNCVRNLRSLQGMFVPPNDPVKSGVNNTLCLSTFRTALLLPSITRRIEDLLLVKELNASFFDHSISEYHLHSAISAPSASVEFDYERLELLGT